MTHGPAAAEQPPASAPEAAAAGVRRRQPPRATVRTVECPTCHAPAGEYCRRRRGNEPRLSNHLARVELATELRYGQKLQLPRMSAEVQPTDEAVKRAVLLDGPTAAAASVAPSGGAGVR